MQQFDKHGYYYDNLLCCIYDEFTAIVCIMLVNSDCTVSLPGGRLFYIRVLSV